MPFGEMTAQCRTSRTVKRRIGQFSEKIWREARFAVICHILPKTIVVAMLSHTLRSSWSYFDYLAPKPTALVGEMKQNNGHVTRFEVIQGHHFWYHGKPACDLLSVNNTN